ncbi:MAG: hypothetical protein IT210_06835 [Armatimonadetes bacterium]|nr:hypothetical protein [Armatimonadota bacterium]
MQIKPSVAIAVIVIVIILVGVVYMSTSRRPKMPDNPYEGVAQMGGPGGKGPGSKGQMPGTETPQPAPGGAAQPAPAGQ